MRFYEKPGKPYPKNNEARLKRRFLFFPMKIGIETRWLEFVTFREEYKYGYSDITDSLSPILGRWEAVEWVSP